MGRGCLFFLCRVSAEDMESGVGLGGWVGGRVPTGTEKEGRKRQGESGVREVESKNAVIRQPTWARPHQESPVALAENIAEVYFKP